MSEKKRKLLIYLTLPIALIWAVYNFPSGKKAPNDVPPPVAEATIQPVVATASEPDARLINIEDQTAKKWGLDPFRTYLANRRGGNASSAQKSWNVKGIVFNPANPLAFVNSKSVRVGDTVDDARVVAIDRKTVTLDYRGREFTLSVNKG